MELFELAGAEGGVLGGFEGWAGEGAGWWWWWWGWGWEVSSFFFFLLGGFFFFYFPLKGEDESVREIYTDGKPIDE